VTAVTQVRRIDAASFRAVLAEHSQILADEIQAPLKATELRGVEVVPRDHQRTNSANQGATDGDKPQSRLQAALKRQQLTRSGTDWNGRFHVRIPVSLPSLRIQKITIRDMTDLYYADSN